MDTHRLLVDVGLERVVVVGKVWDLESHLTSFGLVRFGGWLTNILGGHKHRRRIYGLVLLI